MKKSLIFTLLFLAAPVYAVQPNEAFVAWLEKGMQENHIPGMSIAVIHNYRIEWARGFGMADVNTKKPVTPDVLFQAGSISKPVTAMAALKAVQEGKLTLDGDINKSLVSWKMPDNPTNPGKEVTLRRLLSHSAGINVPGFLGYAKEEKVPTLIQILNGLPPANSEAIKITHPNNPLKKKFEYAGGGYTLVQTALVDQYGAFPETMDNLVLRPLNMSNSTFQQPLPTQFSNFAIPYRPNGEPVTGGPHTYPEGAAAGLWTTPSDLANYVISIQKSLRGDQDQVLTKKSAQLLAVHTESKIKMIEMGLGTLVKLNKIAKLARHGTYFAHAGQNEGYRNIMVGNTKNGDGLIIMSNMSNMTTTEEDPQEKGWQFLMDIEKKIAETSNWK